MSEIANDGGAPRSRPVKVGYLVTGLVFVGLAGIWALSASGVVGGVTVGWLLPAILVGAGVIGLLAMLAGGTRRSRPESNNQPDTWHDTAESDDFSDTRTIPEEDQR
jgi:hypothetical protein